jgi:hypothetical protein
VLNKILLTDTKFRAIYCKQQTYSLKVIISLLEPLQHNAFNTLILSQSNKAGKEIKQMQIEKKDLK